MQYTRIEWPESQQYIGKDWFADEAVATDENGTYLIPNERIGVMKGQQLDIGQEVMVNLYVGYGDRELKTGKVAEIHKDKKDFFKIKIDGIGKIDKWFNTCHSHVMLKV